jgi:outer membrane biosynthesis protein TonB
MFQKGFLPPSLRSRLTAPLLWCFLASGLAHTGLWYGLRWLDPLPEPPVPLPAPIEVTFVEPAPAVPIRNNPPPPPPLGKPLPPPPPVGNVPPVANLPPLPPPPEFAKPVPTPPPPRPKPRTEATPTPPAAPPPLPLPPPVDTPTLPQEAFDPANTSTADGLGNLSRWIASLQPELTRSPKLLRLTRTLPPRGCPWAQAEPAVLGVVVNPQGQIEGTPELLRSAGYATLNQQARQAVMTHDFTEEAAETLQAVMVEVTWENTCPSGA